MDEAVEICKLRLFLKLMAQVECDKSKPNMGVEALPDVDFNIKAGNSLVGFANYKEVKQAVEGKKDGQGFFDLDGAMPTIDEKAETVDRAFKLFRQMQTQQNMSSASFATAKQELRIRLSELENELNAFLAKQYGIDPDKLEYANWLESHKPFHWYIDFYGIVHGNGGFDVIIGNPPYLEKREIDYDCTNLETSDSNAVHVYCIEKGIRLLNKYGNISMIVPLALVSTQRMIKIQNILEEYSNVWYANFAWRPAKLFDTVNRALTIFVSNHNCTGVKLFTTGYQKWNSGTRNTLIETINYSEAPKSRNSFWIPKFSDGLETNVLADLLNADSLLKHFYRRSGNRVYYRTTGGLYWKIFTDFAPKFYLNGEPSHSSRETFFYVESEKQNKNIVAILSSSTFWWWYTLTSNLRDLNPSDIQNFPVSKSMLDDNTLYTLGCEYINSLENNSEMLTRIQKNKGKTQTQSFKVIKSKPLIDEIDKILAWHYGFTEEELDYIINYDIKYRMGKELGNDE